MSAPNVIPVPDQPPAAVGDVYEWMGVRQMITAIREDAAGKLFAQTFVVQPETGKTWTKDQPLPFPAEAQLLCSIDSSAQSFRAGFEAAQEQMRTILAGDSVNDEENLEAISRFVGLNEERTT